MQKFDEKLVRRLHAEYLLGKSLPELAKEHGLVASSIQRAFKRFGLRLKTPAEKKEEKLLKTKRTNLARYGVENVAKVEAHKEKASKTITEKYGDHFSRCDKVKRKKEQTNLERYGSEYFFSTDKFKEHVKRTFEKRYGADHPLRVNEFVQKASTTRKASRLKRLLPILSSLGYELLDTYRGNKVSDKGKHLGYIQYRIRHSCGEVFSDDLFMEPRCPRCFPPNVSKEEVRLGDFIESLGFAVKRNVRDLIVNPVSGKPYEIDLLVLDLGIAFEFNGLFYHTGRKDHGLKTDLCLDKGVKLHHIWEHHRSDIVESRIRNVLGVAPKKLGARKCSVREIELEEARQFLEENHLHGFSGTAAWGLFADELVSVLTFRQTGEFVEIARFASKKNLSVSGAFQKLLKGAGVGGPLLSYCDRDWTPRWEDALYNKVGFKFVRDTGPQLFFYDRKNKRVVARQEFQKWKLQDKFPDLYDKELTAFEILVKASIFPLWTSGNWRFEKF